MTTLKNKLSTRLETTQSIEPENISSSTDPNTSTYDSNENNLILLKPPDTSSPSLVPDFAISLTDAKERIRLLQHFVKEIMIPNVDYGVIPRCDKPSLFKSGAEKLCDIFGFSKQIEVLNRIEDWDSGLFHYEIKAILINKRSGLIEAEGIGCCNSKERKFKAQDSYSIINTLLKIAKKRALIDAVLSATRSSGIFTQDIEDMELTSSSSKPLASTTCNKNNISLITKQQKAEIFLVMQQNHLSKDEVKNLMINKYKVPESNLLTSKQADEFIDLLKCYTTI